MATSEAENRDHGALRDLYARHVNNEIFSASLPLMLDSMLAKQQLVGAMLTDLVLDLGDGTLLAPVHGLGGGHVVVAEFGGPHRAHGAAQCRVRPQVGRSKLLSRQVSKLVQSHLCRGRQTSASMMRWLLKHWQCRTPFVCSEGRQLTLKLDVPELCAWTRSALVWKIWRRCARSDACGTAQRDAQQILASVQMRDKFGYNMSKTGWTHLVILAMLCRPK